jgi:hypothetical protein
MDASWLEPVDDQTLPARLVNFVACWIIDLRVGGSPGD